MTHVVAFVVGAVAGGAVTFFATHRRNRIHVELDLGDPSNKDGPFYE